MKKLLSIALLSSLLPLPFYLSAMPLKWVCNFPDTKAEVFRIYQGETVTFEPSFRINGKTVDLNIEGVYYQTNGMDKAWWKLEGNTFTPTNDVGAASYRFFIQAAGEGGKNYRANGTLRMLPSPGFVPNEITLPVLTFDFAAVDIKNPPWTDAVRKADEAYELVGDIATLVYGEDCQLVSTNYNSTTKLPSLFLRFKIKDEASGEMVWYKVWDELTRFSYLTDEFLPENYYGKSDIDGKLDDKADRAWGFYDSHSGNYAPDGFAWISAPNIALAGGLSYQRIITTEGSIWVLESHGVAAVTGDDKGSFKISDDKGNAIFEISKGTEQIVGATAGTMRTEQISGRTHLFITYNVESSQHPKLQVCRSLKNAEWKSEDDSGCPANVVWSGSSGAYVAEVWGISPESSLFVQATFKKGTRDLIRHNVPVAFSELVIDGVTYRCKVESISGKKVLVLE